MGEKKLLPKGWNLQTLANKIETSFHLGKQSLR